MEFALEQSGQFGQLVLLVLFIAFLALFIGEWENK